MNPLLEIKRIFVFNSVFLHSKYLNIGLITSSYSAINFHHAFFYNNYYN